MKCWKGQNPKIMGFHNSIMELHNSIYGAPLQIVQLKMHYGAPSPFTRVHEQSCFKLNYTELHNLSHHWIII